MLNREVEENLNKMLDELIRQYGHESDPVLYFAQWAWEFPSNRERYYRAAKNWVFDWEAKILAEEV